MNIGFDSQRSEAIRAGLVTEATAAARPRRPWRGLILLLAGALVGSGATTAAFANSLVKDSSPTPGGQDTPGAVVVGSDATDSAGVGGGSVTVRTDAGTGKVLIEYEWDQHLHELSRQQLVVTEPGALDLRGHPAEASYAWVSVACRSKGSIAVGGESDDTAIQVRERGDSKVSGGLIMATMVTLDGPTEQIKPTDGCVADVAVTYYAKD
jgi:hypothetical protein